MNQTQTAFVQAVGPKVDRKNRQIWRKVETDAFRDDPNHIPGHVPRGRKGGKTEFFFLYSNGEPVGKASVVVDSGWLSAEEKADNVGFIDDFVILPDQKHLAGILIDHCVSVLKTKGAAAVIVRSESFPALAAQDFNDLPPGSLPTNPPWYIELFEQRGFVKQQEWANFRLTLPQNVPQAELDRWEALRFSQGLEIKRLGARNRKELKQYADVVYEVFSGHYGYNPSRSHPFAKFLLFAMANLIARYRIYVVRSQSGEILGFFSYHPDYNIARKALAKYYNIKWYDYLALLRVVPDLLRPVRTAKRAAGGGFGFREESRRKGLIRSMDSALQGVIEEGYEQLDTGSVLIDNAVVVKMIQRTGKKYGVKVQQMKYYTLKYEFQPTT